MHSGQFILKCILCIGCLLAGGGRLEAQADFNIRLWQSEDGLPNNIVQAIAQTKDGYIWVGTREGLARFDGEHFQVVNLLPQSPQPSVICLLGNEDGSLWIGTENAGIFHLSEDNLTQLELPTAGHSFGVYEIQESQDGGIWFGTSHGILRWSNGKIEHIRTTKTSQQRFCTDGNRNVWLLDNGLKRLDALVVTNYPLISGALPGRARSMYCDPDGTFWFGTDIGKENALISLQDGMITRYERSPGPSGFVSVTFRDSTGVIWVGSYAGLDRLVNGAFENFRTSEFSSYRIYSIFEDREQNLWVGSEEGLTRMTRMRFKTVTQKNGLALNAVVSVCPSQDGGVWIGSWGAGINHYLDGKTTYLKTTNGLKSNYTMGMTEAHDGSLWAGADYGGPLQRIKDGQVTIYDRPRGFHQETATVVLCEDKHGTLWIGNRDGLQTWDGTNFTRYTTKEGLCNNTINAISEGVQEDLWIGTDGGLMQWKDGKFINLAAHDSRLRVSILSLFQDAQRTVWIGTKGHGLLMFRDGTVKEFSSREGLLSDFIYSVLEDNHTNLWLNSSRGIFRVDKRQAEAEDKAGEALVTSISYGKADGILASSQFRDVTQPSACKDLRHRLWFRTTQGAVMIDPDVVAVSHEPPPVVIQKVIADGKPMMTGNLGLQAHGLIVVPPGRGELEIQFAALSYTVPEKNLYCYQLTGVDSDWVNAGNLRVTKYNNLHPGRYQFRVKACNNDGVWNEAGQSVELILEPHFWQTLWFYSLCGMVAVGVVGGTVRYITRRRMQKKLTQLERQRAVEQERTRIARDVHDELGAKLTQISFQGGIAMCSLNNPGEIRSQIEQMSVSAREAVSSLHEIIWAADPKNDSLEGLIGHISHYAEEFFNACAIRCEVVAPEHIPVRHISAGLRHNLFLAVKEAVNNAAKHAKATRVLIQISVRAGELEILVSDNGGGFKVEGGIDAVQGRSAHTGQHGLVNMQVRLASINGRCEVNSEEGQGTTIHFVIPLAS